MSNRSKDREYRLWRARCIRRDKVCAICGSKEKRTAHHINSWSYFPEQRYDDSNSVCLCSKCHMNFHCNFKRSYKQKCTKYDFDNFVVLKKYAKDIFCNTQCTKNR